MITSTKKGRAMMAARILADVAAAPILNSSLARSALVAGSATLSWIRESDPSDEVFSSGAVIVSMLEKVEAHARGMESVPIEKVLIEDLWRARRSVVIALQRKKKGAHRVSGNVEADKRHRMPKGEPNKQQNLWKEPKLNLYPLFTMDEVEEDDWDDDDEGAAVVEAIPVRLPEDIRQCHIMASSRTFLLWLFATFFIAFGVLGVSLLFLQERTAQWETLQKNVTLEQGTIGQDALKAAYPEASKEDMTTSIALSLLAKMGSTSNSYSREIFFDSDNYLSEYRASLQDFTRENIVTEVLSPRLLGGICQELLTFLFLPQNDIFCGQEVVFLALTPNDCANDAIQTGVFQKVTPSFLRYTKNALNYRRRDASISSFYSSSFSLSVALTRDRNTLQDTLIPPGAKAGDADIVDSPSEVVTHSFVLQVALSFVNFSCGLFLVIMWMTISRSRYRNVIFPILMSIITFVALVVTIIILRVLEQEDTKRALMLNLASKLEAITSAALSSFMVEHDLSLSFLRDLAEGDFSGRLALTDPKGSSVYPSGMKALMQKIDSSTIASFRRGQYVGITENYAICSIYVESVDTNIFLIEGINRTKQHGLVIGIAIVLGVVAGIVTAIFIQCSLLARIGRYAFGFPLLRYYINGEDIRFFLYLLIFALTICGSMVAGFYATWMTDSSTTKSAQASLTLLSACIRAPSIGSVCSSGCGMPDFISVLYFELVDVKNVAYPEIKVVEGEMPLPFPAKEGWEQWYLGAQLASSGLHTTLLNVPSFSTPLVNKTWNGTNPQFTVRNLICTSVLNATHSFSIERFQDSLSPKNFRFLVQSSGFALFFLLSTFLTTFLEWQHLQLHHLYKMRKPLRKQYIVSGTLIIVLPIVFFLLYGLLMRVYMNREFYDFAVKELEFITYAINHRLVLSTLDNDLIKDQDSLLQFLISSTADISSNVMQGGSRYLRFAVGREYPERGSGKLLFPSWSTEKVVDLGLLDDASLLTKCAFNNTFSLSEHTSGPKVYCYQEIPQNFGSISRTPRLFLVALISYKEWVEDETTRMWKASFLVTMLIGLTATIILMVLAFFAAETAHSSGYPLWSPSMDVSFEDPVPERFTIEKFVPRLHKLLWLLFFIVIALFGVYYTVSVGKFVDLFMEAMGIWLPVKTYSQSLTALIQDAEYASYNFVVFPFAEKTYGKLLSLGTSGAEDGSEYPFVTQDGKQQFETATKNIYQNFSQTPYSLEDRVLSASYGADSFNALISQRYMDDFVKEQEKLLSMLSSFGDTFIDTIDRYSLDGRYSSLLDCAKITLELQDYFKKLFILDHMFINSLASATTSGTSWPFDGDAVGEVEEKITSPAKSAAEELTSIAETSLKNLKKLISTLSYDPVDSISALDTITNIFPNTVALNLHHNSIWTLQNERQAAITAQFDDEWGETQNEEKARLLQCIAEQEEYFDLSKSAESSFRKTQQLIEYIQDSMPLRLLFTALPWQRIDDINAGGMLAKMAFGVTVICYVACSISAFLFFVLLRERTIMCYRDWYDTLQDSFRFQNGSLEEEEEDAVKLEENESPKRLERRKSPIQESDRIPFKRANERNGKESDKHLSIVNEERKGVQTRNPLQLPLQADETSFSRVDDPSFYQKKDSADVEPKVSPSLWNLFGMLSPEKSRSSVISLRVEREVMIQLRKMLIVLLISCWLLTLVSFGCAFILLNILQKSAHDFQSEISALIDIHSSVTKALESEKYLLPLLSMYYAGATPLTTIRAALHDYTTLCTQVFSLYLWAKGVDEAPIILAAKSALESLQAIVEHEMNTFKDATDVEDPYYVTQSQYSRTFLPGLTSTNTYGALLPPSVTTGESAVQVFLLESYDAILSKIEENAAMDAVTSSLKEFAAICKELDRASTAALNMWHAVIASGTSNGVEAAGTYSNFVELVGEDAIFSTLETTEASAVAAMTEISTYYEKLLKLTATQVDVRKLFTETLTVPVESSPQQSSDAYLAAAYTSSYLRSITTTSQFVNEFGYNRELNQETTTDGTSSSTTPTLLSVFRSSQEATQAIFQSLSEGFTTGASSGGRNPWIWQREYVVEDVSTDSSFTANHLKYSILWCCTAAFWGVICLMAISYWFFFS